jgi:hypothetical protein
MECWLEGEVGGLTEVKVVKFRCETSGKRREAQPKQVELPLHGHSSDEAPRDQSGGCHWIYFLAREFESLKSCRNSQTKPIFSLHLNVRRLQNLDQQLYATYSRVSPCFVIAVIIRSADSAGVWPLGDVIASGCVS